jgi:hypothetical protein
LARHGFDTGIVPPGKWHYHGGEKQMCCAPKVVSLFDGVGVAIGSLEILFCALVAAGALGVYCLLVMLLGRGAAKGLRKDGLAVFGLFVLCAIAAVLTPPDMVTLLMLAIPLCVLYSVGATVWLLIRYRRQLGAGPDVQKTKEGEKA